MSRKIFMRAECPHCDHVEAPVRHYLGSSCGGRFIEKGSKFKCEECGAKAGNIKCDSCEKKFSQDYVTTYSN